MNWHLNIPKILHVYWGGGNLPYLRYMTVRSFINHNPDWEVYLWHPECMITLKTDGICEDYLPELMKLSIKEMVFDATQYGFFGNMTPAQTSDLISYYALSTMGGVWADMDILFIKSMTELVVNSEINASKEVFVCISEFGHAIGFLMGSIGNDFFYNAFTLSRECLNPNDWQSIGSKMLNTYYPTLGHVNNISPAVNIDMDSVYPYNWVQVAELLKNESRITKNTIGVHWYGGHPVWKEFYERTNGGLSNLSNSVIENLLKNESNNNNGNKT